MLFLRQSGFQEKEFFYELYPETVEFNVCNVGNVEPLDKVHVDTSQGAVDYVAIEAGRLTITYKPSSSGVDDSLANPAVESAPQ